MPGFQRASLKTRRALNGNPRPSLVQLTGVQSKGVREIPRWGVVPTNVVDLTIENRLLEKA
jgi:hypothetical protein